MIARQMRHPVANRLAMLFGIVAIIVVAYSPSFASLWALWQTSDHRHGILVFPIAAWLVWQARHGLADVPVRADARGLPVLLLLVAAWLAARLTGVQVVEHAAVLGLVPAAVLTLLGPGIFSKLLFPLGFLLLATPVSDSFIPFLMTVTADISTALLRLSGFPVLREGQYLSLPGGNFVVADVCSGARYLVTGVMVALLFGYFTYRSMTKRAALVLVTALALVLANGARAYIVMAVASATDMQYLGGRDHIYFGWALFGMVMMLIMWLGARFADAGIIADDPRYTETVTARASHAALPVIIALGLVMLAITIKPLQADFGEIGAMLAAAGALLVFTLLVARQQPAAAGHSSGSGAGRVVIDRGGVVSGLVAVALLVGTPQLVSRAEGAAVSDTSQAVLALPDACREAGPWPHRWRPQFREPDVEQAAALVCEEGQAALYMAAYSSALQGRELVSSAHRPVPPAWDRYSSATTRALASGRGADVVEVSVIAPGYEAIVWYWYEIDGATATGPLEAKLYQLAALLTGRPAGGRVIVLESAMAGDAEAARERLGRIAAALLSQQANDAQPDVP